MVVPQIFAVIQPPDRIAVLCRKRLFEKFPIVHLRKPGFALAHILPFRPPLQLAFKQALHFGRIETCKLGAVCPVARHRDEMPVLIVFHIPVFGERAQICSLRSAEYMDAPAADRLFRIRLAALGQHFVRKRGTLAVLPDTVVEVDARDTVRIVQRIGKRHAAVFFCILARRVEVRPCFGLIALGKLARMYVDEEFIQSARFLVLARAHHHPVGLVLHLVGQALA